MCSCASGNPLLCCNFCHFCLLDFFCLFLMERRKLFILKRGINTYLWEAASLKMNIYSMLYT